MYLTIQFSYRIKSFLSGCHGYTLDLDKTFSNLHDERFQNFNGYAFTEHTSASITWSFEIVFSTNVVPNYVGH